MAPASKRDLLKLAPPSKDIRAFSGDGDSPQGAKRWKKGRFEETEPLEALDVPSSSSQEARPAAGPASADAEAGPDVPAGQPSPEAPAGSALTIVEEDDIEVQMEALSGELREMAARRLEEAAASKSGLSPKEEKYLQQLDEIVEKGGMDSRSPIAQRMMRSLDPEALKGYKRLDSDSKRRDFRLAWAKEEHSAVTARKCFTKCWQRVDEKKGTYKTLEAVAVEFGYAVDKAKAVAAATSYCKACVELGGRWTMGCPMSKQQLFLFLEVQHRELMSDAWTLMKESSRAGTASAKTPVEEKAATKPTEQVQKPQKPQKGGKGNVGTATLMAQAAKIRTRVLAALTRANGVVEKVAGDPKWAWAEGSSNIGMVTSALAAVQQRLKESDADDLLHVELPLLKRTLSPNEFEKKLLAFVAAAETVQELEKAYATIWKMHRARG